MTDRFRSFSDLARDKREGEDYAIAVHEAAGSAFVIVAPHGGSIEPYTSDIARRIAGNDFSLYLFEGLEVDNAFYELHVDSRRFDEPRCLDIATRTQTAITVHGSLEREEVIFMGGLDAALKSSLAQAFNAAGLKVVEDGHSYPGTSPANICNRGKVGKGVQLEFSRGIRDDAVLREKCADIVRDHLKRL